MRPHDRSLQRKETYRFELFSSPKSGKRSSGVIESSTGTYQLAEEDCVALAASMIGELVALGEYDKKRLLDDRQQVERLAKQPLENFRSGSV